MDQKMDPTTAALMQDVEMLFMEILDVIQGREPAAEFQRHLDIFIARRKAATPE